MDFVANTLQLIPKTLVSGLLGGTVRLTKAKTYKLNESVTLEEDKQKD